MAAQHTSHSSRGAEAVIVAAVSTAIASLALIFRIITKTIIVHNFGPEDLVLLISFAFSVALTALVCVEVQDGLGRHFETVSPRELTEMNKAFWASVPVYQASLALTKISILLQYQRVFVGPMISRVIRTVLALTIVYGIWSVCATAFMCIPVSYFWNPDINGHCLTRMGLWFANASLNILGDIILCVLPMPVLNKLRLPRRQKNALMGVFGLGAFVCLTSILRLKSLYDISVSTDSTWDNTPAAYWSSLEVNFSITAACLPSLRKAISILFPRSFSAYSATASHRCRSSRKGSAFKNFHAQGDWIQGLQSQNMTARECTTVGSEDRIELDKVVVGTVCEGSTPNDGDKDTLGASRGGGIRVITTITTQEVEQVDLESSAGGGPDKREGPTPS